MILWQCSLLIYRWNQTVGRGIKRRNEFKKLQENSEEDEEGKAKKMESLNENFGKCGELRA